MSHKIYNKLTVRVKPIKVLVIGANGFIGSHLVDGLVAQGYTVRALDNYSTYPKFNQSHQIELIKGSSFDTKVLNNSLQDVEFVFHAISATTPFTSDNDPFTDINKNLVHNIEVFDCAVKAGVKKLIFISSGGAVYGKVSEKKVVTEYDAPMPVSPYGINKLASEYYLEYFKRKFGLDYIAYRLTNPYGPRQTTKHNQGVIPSFLQKINDKEDLVVYGDGSASRDYIYIGDAIKMMLSSFSKHNKYPVYNLCSGKQTKLITIIKTLEGALCTKASIRYVEAPKTFLERAMISNDRFTKEFGIEPTTTLAKGIKKMISK